MAFTYDVSTDRGKVRALATDVDSANYTFDDAEIDAFIALAPSNLFTAAALAVETWARTRAHLSQSMHAASGVSSARYRMAELLSLASSLRSAALSNALVTDAWNTGAPNELLDSYRPEWRHLSDAPVAE